MDENALKELLTRENPEFRQAARDHQDCERELKKRKLALKDRMYQIMLDYERKA